MKEIGAKKFKILKREQEILISQITFIFLLTMKKRTMRASLKRSLKIKESIFNSK
jgi:hypothetical protein